MRTAPARCSAGRTHTAGAPSERVSARHAAGILALVEDARRRARSGARPARRAPPSAGAPEPCAAAGVRGPRGAATASSTSAERRPERRAAARAGGVLRGGASCAAPATGRPRPPRDAQAQALEDPPAAAGRCGSGASAACAVALAHPAGVGGPGSAQLADRAGAPVGEEDLVVLAAQQPARAQLAGDVGLGCDDRSGCHLRRAVRAVRRVSRGVRRRRRPARRPSGPGARGAPRSAGTRACSRPGRR